MTHYDEALNQRILIASAHNERRCAEPLLGARLVWSLLCALVGLYLFSSRSNADSGNDQDPRFGRENRGESTGRHEIQL